MQVVIIGSGNVATILGKLLLANHHTVREVVGRNSAKVTELAAALDTKAQFQLHKMAIDADLYLIAVADKAIADVAKQMPAVQGLVVHTAGSVPKNIIQKTSAQYGVLWPLQSITKETQALPVIPFVVDANSEAALNKLVIFAKTLSNQVVIVNDAERVKLHLAAVIAANFSNHLYALTFNYCQTEGLDFTILFPLIQQTAIRLQQYEPAKMQTGPAVRGDITTMQRHLQLLEPNSQLQKIYQLLSSSIQQLIK